MGSYIFVSRGTRVAFFVEIQNIRLKNGLGFIWESPQPVGGVMCQMSVFLKKKNMDSEEKVAENAALLQMTEAGAVIISLFDESRTFAGVQVQQIDFLKGKVVLEEVDR